MLEFEGIAVGSGSQLVASNHPQTQPSLWNRPAWALLLIAVAVILLLIPLPQEGRVLDACGDMLHGPLFALLAVALQRGIFARLIRFPWGSGVVAWLTTSLLGIASEIAQLQVGREGSVEDAAADMLGAAAGICWSCSTTASLIINRRALRTASLGLFAAAAWLPARVLYDTVRQQWQMPLIASFEDGLELTRWNPHESRLNREQAHATDGHLALRVDVEPGSYPGAVLRWPVSNWLGYTSLVFDAACEAGHDLELTVKVQDADHNNQPNDRFQRRLNLTEVMTRYEIPLEDIVPLPSGRKLDLARVDLLQFYIRRPSEPRTFYVDNIRLQ